MKILFAQLGVYHSRVDPDFCLALARESDVPDFEKLKANTPFADAQHNMISVRGEQFALNAWSVGTRRYCPACLVDSAHHRFFWDMTFIRVCPFHGLTLEGGTGAKRVLWSHSDLRLSSNGEWLPQDAPLLDGSTSSLEAYALGRFGILKSMECPLLDGEQLEDVDWGVRTLGLMLARPDFVVAPSKRNLPTDPDIITAGFGALSSSFDHLCRTLSSRAEAVLAQLPSRTEAGANKLFGRAHFVSHSSSLSLAALIIEAMNQVVTSVGRTRGFSRTVDAVGNQKSFVAAEVAAELGISKKSFPRILDLTDIPRRAERGVVTFYTRDDVEIFRQVIDGGYTAPEVAVRLALRPRDLQPLQRARCLRTLWLDRGNGRTMYYHGPDVDSVADQFRLLNAPTTPTITFHMLASHLKISPGEMAVQVLKGGYVPCGRFGDGPGFRGTLFKAPNGIEGRPAGLSLRAASAYLGVTPLVVLWLCETGRLVAGAPPYKRGGIDLDSVIRLESAYVSVTRLAAHLGRDNRGASKYIQSLGVEVLGPSPTTAGLASRSDLEKVAPELIAVSPEDIAWKRLRTAAALDCKPWRLPSALVGTSATCKISSQQIVAVLEFGAGLSLTANVSPLRRWRIVQSAMMDGRKALAGFHLKESEDGKKTLVSKCPTDAHQAEWLSSALKTLSAVFGPRNAGKTADPDKFKKAESLRRWRQQHMATMRSRKG